MAAPPPALQHILAGVLVLDMIYLVVLLILRLVWGDDSTDPSRECGHPARAGGGTSRDHAAGHQGC